MKLSHFKVGMRGVITGLAKGNHLYRQRLIAMGLIKGVEFIVARIAPLGDPMEITLRGFSLSLRKDEANILEVELLA